MLQAIALALLAAVGFAHTPAVPTLEAAIREGNGAAVASLVAAGADINQPDAAGTPPLVAAILSNQIEIARFLLAHGVNVNARQQQTGGSALFYAVTMQRAQLTEMLLKANARTDIRYGGEQTVLHVAAVRGEAASVAALLDHGAGISAEDAAGNTPLDEAVLHGHADVAQLLLEHHADPDRAHGANARGPLDEAAISGYPQIVQLLIKYGADVTAHDNSGQSALDLALAYKNGTVVHKLLEVASTHPALRTQFSGAMDNAVSRGRTFTARLLLESGWNVNEPTAAGSTYLNDAALKGNVALARMLLDHGAALDSHNSQGGTPLHDAAISGNPDLIRLLLDKGAAIDARDTESAATPLMLAASLGNNAAVVVLLKAGANPLLVDRSGRSALIRAQEAQNPEVVKLLERAGRSAAKT